MSSWHLYRCTFDRYHNNFQDRIKALPFEAGQNVWLQNSDSRKYEEAVICEKCREPNSYMVEIPATGQCFRRNSNFIKPRQSKQKPVPTELQPTTAFPEIPQESPVLQQPAAPSSQATSTVDAIPTVPPSKQNGNSTPRTPRQPRTSRRSTKGIPPPRLGLQEWHFMYRHSHFRKGDVAIWVRMTLSAK